MPDEIRIEGSGTIAGRVDVDGFTSVDRSHTTSRFVNDAMELTIYRELNERPAPTVGLTATWDGQPDPITLVEARANS